MTLALEQVFVQLSLMSPARSSSFMSTAQTAFAALLLTLCSAARDGSARLSSQLDELHDLAPEATKDENSGQVVAKSQKAKPGGAPKCIASKSYGPAEVSWLEGVVSDCFKEEDLDGWAVCIGLDCNQKWPGLHHQVVVADKTRFGTSTFATKEATFDWGDFLIKVFTART